MVGVLSQTRGQLIGCLAAGDKTIVLRHPHSWKWTGIPAHQAKTLCNEQGQFQVRIWIVGALAGEPAMHLIFAVMVVAIKRRPWRNGSAIRRADTVAFIQNYQSRFPPRFSRSFHIPPKPA